MQDTYKTISKASDFSLYKDKGSKFYGYAFPVGNENDISEAIEQLKKEHSKARHWCYAWRLGSDYSNYRINDDGEPSGSAGLPIYGQIQSKELTNVLVVVVRYFGGTKLGVSGLIKAYKYSAQLALEVSKIIEKTVDDYFKLTFPYSEMDKVLRVLNNTSADIRQQSLEMECTYIIGVRKSESENVVEMLEELRSVKSTKIDL